jgi:hypothetical protein
MEDSAGVAVGVPIVRDDWLVSDIPGKAISVRLSRDVVLRLGMAVREGFKALPRRGLETGGLLIGRTRKDTGGRLVVDIADFEPVESEHASGPSYLLSDVDRRLLEARIAAREGSGKKPGVVGFYRSHTRRNFATTVEDTALFSTYFRKGSDIFLLIKSNDDGPPTCGLLVREGGRELSGSPYAQFPLDRTVFTEPERATPVPARIPPAPPAPAAPVEAVPAVRVQPLPQRRNPLPLSRLRIWPAIAIGVVLAASAYVAIQWNPRPSQSLALNVTATGDNLRLSWGRQSLRQATHGVLWIQDGQDEHKVELDSKQLDEGSVSYWPKSTDVNFRLELTSPSGKVTESVRAIGGPSLKPAAIPAAPAPAPALAAEKRPAPAKREPAIRAAVEPPAFRPSPVGSASRRGSREFTAPSPEPAKPIVARAALPDPPAIQPPGAPTLDRGKEFLKTIAPASDAGARAGADSTLRVDAEPVPHLGRNIPLIGKRSPRSDYVPPVPAAKSAALSLPHREVAREVNIDVKVYVNSSGKVDYAELLSNVPKADSDLAALVVFSARRWEFVPAREGNEAVPGEVILHYQFGPGAVPTTR